MKAFITGGAGFVGSSMADRLLLGPANSVTVYDNLSAGAAGNLEHIAESDRFRIIRGDLLDLPGVRDALAGHDIVYHFAAPAASSSTAEDMASAVQGNVTATHNLLEAMRAHGLNKIIFLSHSAVYGACGANAPGENFSPVQPATVFGAGKLGAEALICAYSQLFNMTSYIFRMTNIVGGKQTHGVAHDFIRSLREDPSALTVADDPKRTESYIHIDDVLNAIFFIMAMARERINIYNVATDDVVDIDWVARCVVMAMKLSVEPVYTGERAGGGVPVSRLDTNKIRRFGWTPRYGSQDAMLRSIDQMLQGMKQPQ